MITFNSNVGDNPIVSPWKIWHYRYRRSSEAKCGVMLYQMVFHPMSTVVEIAELRGIFLKEGGRKKPLIPYQDVMASATG